MPLIKSDIILINSNADITTALKLRYTQTPQQKSLFDTYRYQYYLSILYNFAIIKVSGAENRNFIFILLM